MHREDLRLWRQGKAEGACREGQPLDFRIVTQLGAVRWVSVARGLRRFGPDLGIRTSIRDITDRKLMEQKLAHQAMHDP